jgi:4-amino-4-deoxy-L-arabinose transferase-like glycosyltransferase
MGVISARADLGVPAAGTKRPVWSGATLAVAVLTGLALALRLTQLDQSLFADEVYSYHDVAGRSLLGMLRAIHPPDENAPPLFFVLAWLSAKLGNPTVWIRLPSLILSTATIPITYLLGRETLGRAAGLIGAAILALSPFTLYYAIEARPYASVACFVTLAALAVVKAVRTGELRWWVAYTLSAAAAAYSHYTGIFALAVLGVWSLWACRGHLRAPLIANAAAVLLYVPWIPHLGARNLAVIGGLEPLTLHNMGTDLLRVVAGYPYAGPHAIPTLAGVVAIGLCGLLGVLSLGRIRLGRGSSQSRQPARGLGGLGVIGALAVSTPLGVLLYSAVSTDLWDARDLYASAPAAFLVLGALLAAIPRPLGVGATAVVLVVLVAGTIRSISPRYARPAFRAAASYLDRVAAPSDPVVIYPSFLGLDGAILAQFRHPHRLIFPPRFPAPPAGGADYAVLDDSAARALKIATPRPAGFVLAARRHYRGLVGFSLLTYRPLGP